MTTSGTTDFSLTARDIVTTALEENGIIALGTEPTADELAACIRRMNGMLKTWQGQGIVWKQETITQAIDADEASVELPAYVRGVNGCRYIESATNERQMRRFERDEYYSLPNKAAAGTPTVYYYARRTAADVLYVWPVPSANYSLKLDIDRKLDTVTNAGQTVDIPEELTETVYSALAVRCAGVFGAEITQELDRRAAILERQMSDNYRPASYFMGAD